MSSSIHINRPDEFTIIRTLSHWLGDKVYRHCDPDQHMGVVVGVMIVEGALMYQVQWKGEISLHYSFELTDEKQWVSE